MHKYLTAALTAATILALVAPAGAQINPGGPSGGKRIGGPLAGLEGDANLDQPVSIAAQFTAATTDRPAVLMITAQIIPGYHVYSLTQPPGGPTKTKIEVTPSPKFKLIGQFHGTPEPKSHIDQQAWKGLTLEEHEDEVTWYAPIELAAGTDPAKLEIAGTVRMLACKDSCVPVNLPFQARLGPGVPIGPLDLTPQVDQAQATNSPPQPTTTPPNLIAITAASQGAASVGNYQAEGSAVRIAGRIEPATVQAGGTANVIITATPEPGWHIYAWAPRDEGKVGKPTLLAVAAPDGFVAGQPMTPSAIKTNNSVPQVGEVRYHEGPVTWTIPVKAPADAKAGQHAISGFVAFQACESRDDSLGSCELPKGVLFNGTLTLGNAAGAGSAPLSFVAASYTAVAKSASASSAQTVVATTPENQPQVATGAAYDLDRIDIKETTHSLGYYMLFAFVGGIILNLMPCVLPVIGLKVMSFVEQAGTSRAHALALNAWYSAGIVAVFLLLGLLASSIGLSWGGQFGNTAFNATLAGVVFAMALSLLGVWEIPIPGFFGGNAVHEMAAQEGPTGAFLKGAITTVLATPCTGPFMATAIAWAVTQSLSTTLIVFATLGLGMASPYLVVGVFPELLQFLPRPGAWMETFKQLMGFVLIATVVFILSFMNPVAVLPTLVLLLGIGVSCWLVARTPLTAEFSDRAQSWALAAAVTLLFAVGSYGYLYPHSGESPTGAPTIAAAITQPGGAWQPFSLTALQQAAVDERRTVLVDFSAEWCLTCKTLEQAVLHSDSVTQAIAQAGVVTMYADYTNQPPEIEETIRKLKSNGVPVIAIFPGDRPYEPLVFRGAYTRDGLIEALSKATGRNLEGSATIADTTAGVVPLK